jgi:C4-dicarboxylate-specific signal transduction histidine kinase
MPSHQEIRTQVETELANDLTVQGNAIQLQQVLLNLILNAAEAMVNGGRIQLRGGSSDTHVWLTIHDNGPGIAAEDLDHVFDSFFTTKRQGTGPGLSVSYGIIQDHDGELTVETSGQGSTFKILLPRAT